jgi:hypothetical protein
MASYSAMKKLLDSIVGSPDWRQVLRPDNFLPTAGLTYAAFAYNNIQVGPHFARANAPATDYAIMRNINHPDHFRHEIREGDFSNYDEISAQQPTNPRNRSELQSNLEKFDFDTSIWISYSLKPTFSIIDAEWTIIGQVHATEDGSELATNPIFKMEVRAGNTLYLLTAGSQQDPMVTHSTPVVQWSGDGLISGRPEHYVFRLVASKTGGAGELQAWRNGTELCNVTGIDCGYIDVQGPYFIRGIYRKADGLQPFVAEYANIEFGHADLSGRILNPLPWPKN